MNQLQEIKRLASKVMTKEYLDTWLVTPSPVLGWLNPIDAIKAGKFEQVRRLLMAVQTGGLK